MPVVIKSLVNRGRDFATERDAYLRIDGIHDSSNRGFPSLLHHDQFETAEGDTVYYLVLQYLGPTLHDIMMQSCYKRFTAKMTLAVAIQLVRKVHC